MKIILFFISFMFFSSLSATKDIFTAYLGDYGIKDLPQKELVENYLGKTVKYLGFPVEDFNCQNGTLLKIVKISRKDEEIDIKFKDVNTNKSYEAEINCYDYFCAPGDYWEYFNINEEEGYTIPFLLVDEFEKGKTKMLENFIFPNIKACEIVCIEERWKSYFSLQYINNLTEREGMIPFFYVKYLDKIGVEVTNEKYHYTYQIIDFASENTWEECKLRVRNSFTGALKNVSLKNLNEDCFKGDDSTFFTASLLSVEKIMRN